ncbi:Crp/Fnr family transcriptional regulator [Methylobacterium organophilum]|uniref:HTH crp-type domain-containing protein n=1 Tax=Methylobacterium organophilum TaxID=410 RepID=A0ABQ4TED1_METOR|nr:Crp/Fnr family transcriptional regulator [Methylobacterium organophilum]UMY16145.1 Crp/Fnr family transcriptional regulator [Methylobacterium organophilum]GJE28884.1 hypothetical protein LKMONMHP_3758 [Methylobacterium organophilum]
MTNPFIRKLENFCALNDEERYLIEVLCRHVRRVEARTDIVQQGDEPRCVNLVLAGWACRYKQFADGRRQIISLFVPGDLCDPHIFVMRSMDHSLATITPISIVRLSEEAIDTITRSPRLQAALWWDSLVTSAIHREGIVSLGQRSAAERLAHFFCELSLRLQAVGLGTEAGYELPLTQQDIAEMLGITNVHVNRTLRDMRDSGLVTLRGRQLTIHDFTALKRLAIFDPSYLHQGRESVQLDSNVLMRAN